MDVTDDASMVAGIERIVDEQGRIDVLVNNAGYGSYGAVEDVPIDEARRQFEVNVFGLARLDPARDAPHAGPGVAAGSSTSAASAGSSTSRSARGTTRPSSRWRASATACALELAPYGIRVVIIEPGPIRTEWNDDRPRQPGRDQPRDGVRGAGRGRPARAWRRPTSRGRPAAPTSWPARSSRPRPPTRPEAALPGRQGAGSILAARRVLPDRTFDSVITSRCTHDRRPAASVT